MSGLVELGIMAILGLLMVLTGLALVFLKNPVHAAIAFLVNLCITAVMYLAVMSAPFVAIVQVIVYMGAVLVFVLFVIMLVNLGKGESTERFFTPRLLFSLAVVLIFVIQMLTLRGFSGEIAPIARYIHAKDIADVLFSKYVLPFELVSVLIFAAAVGAVALAKKRM